MLKKIDLLNKSHTCILGEIRCQRYLWQNWVHINWFNDKLAMSNQQFTNYM